MERTKTTAEELKAIENGIETRKFWRAVNAFTEQLELLPLVRRRAWINWLYARLEAAEDLAPASSHAETTQPQ